MSPGPLIQRADRKPVALVVLIALAVHVGTGLGSAAAAGTGVAALGVYFDGHLYMEIARSFPLPFAAAGRDYLGQAPGYPGLAYLGRLLLPNALVDWGLLMLLASWIPAALCAGAFYLLCRQTGTEPLWPSLLFVVANPRWMALAGTPHAEPLAMLCAILSLLTFVRGQVAWCSALLAGAVMVRYPALVLGLPVAFSVLVLQRRFTLRNLALLSIPLVALGLFNLYLFLRLPDFPGILEAHRVFWNASLTWPFAALYKNAARWLWSGDYPLFEVTYGFLAFYLASIAIGLRPRERELWILPLWVAALVLFHVSLSGLVGAWDFTRLVILAWPAALLIVWRWIGARIPPLGSAALCAAALAFGLWFSIGQARTAVQWQRAGQPFLEEKIRGLDSDEPDWIDFREIVRQKLRQQRSPPSRRR